MLSTKNQQMLMFKLEMIILTQASTNNLHLGNYVSNHFC